MPRQPVGHLSINPDKIEQGQKTLTAGLVERLSTKGALGRWTSNIISMYLRHEKAQQVLSKCHTKDDWGILNYLPEPQA
ncbi:MAG: hypothetical protein PHG60_02280 [Candidatus Dojkabacteria bacterium]|jgi:hypothetical protein|nr:hypothetical protein [Candidatus Dojkabacteria bacterium]